MKPIIVSLIASAILFSCQQTITETAIVKAPVDSLIANWSNSWSNHDSAGVRNLFAKDALLIDDDFIANNAEEVSDKWISPNIDIVSHFKTTKLQDWSTNDRAGYTGKYEFDAIVNDSLMAQPKGIYTINWIKTSEGDWKITTATIYSLGEKK